MLFRLYSTWWPFTKSQRSEKIHNMMHLGSLESTQEARVALGCASSKALTLLECSPNFQRASITRYTHAKHEPILNLKVLTLFPITCRYGWRGRSWTEIWKNWPKIGWCSIYQVNMCTIVSFYCVKSIVLLCKELIYCGQPSLIKFIWYHRRSFTEAFCLWFKP